MASIYPRFQQIAKRLLNKYGTLVDITVRTTVPAQNAWEEAKPDERVVKDVLCVFTAFDLEDVDGSRIIRGDRKAMIASLDLPLDIDFSSLNIQIKEKASGKTEQVISALEVRPGDLSILRTFHVRKL